MVKSGNLIRFIFIVIFSSLVGYNLTFAAKAYPNQFIERQDVSGKTDKEIEKLLENAHLAEEVKLKSGDFEFSINPQEIEANIDTQKTVDAALNLARSGNIVRDFITRISLLTRHIDTGIYLSVNKEKLNEKISDIESEVNVDITQPKIDVVNKKIQITPGKAGVFVDKQLLETLILSSIVKPDPETIEIPTNSVDNSINEKRIEEIRQKATNLVGKRITFKHDYEEFTYKDQAIVQILLSDSDYNLEEIKKIEDGIAKAVNAPPQSPKFEFSNGRVKEFVPSKDGVELNSQKFEELFVQEIENLIDSDDKSSLLDLPVVLTPPPITTDKINDLGINERIGRGYSEFRGSISSRIYNITLAASKFDGVLIPPGETFSFNKTLGDVSKLTGYKEAYVIQDNKTVLGDGGGVCQVSSTFFRAALDTGLPIVERRAHSYRVGYYEQNSYPGLDATVYDPSPDLKVVNDTPNNILIQTFVDRSIPSLTFEFYGTSDGRVATTSRPVTTDVVPAGDDVYIDDPTLPAGTVKQTEHRANGAKVVFNYKVTRDGKTLINKTFTSNYRPWPAVYLRGTAQ